MYRYIYIYIYIYRHIYDDITIWAPVGGYNGIGTQRKRWPGGADGLSVDADISIQYTERFEEPECTVMYIKNYNLYSTALGGSPPPISKSKNRTPGLQSAVSGNSLDFFLL